MKCQFIKPDGTRCNANAMAGSKYCFTHNPDTQKEKQLAVLKGGLAPKKFFIKNQEEISLKTAKDAKDFLAKVINAVWVGEIPATPVANTLGFLVRCFLDSVEKADIETRLDEIEQRLEKGGI